MTCDETEIKAFFHSFWIVEFTMLGCPFFVFAASLLVCWYFAELNMRVHGFYCGHGYAESCAHCVM